MKLKDKQPGIEEKEGTMSRHLIAVATSTLHLEQLRHQLKRRKLSRQQFQEKRSRQHLVVATSFAKRRGRDNNRLLRQQLLIEEVTTTPGCHDNNCKDQNVATSISCRDVSFTEKMSRQEQAVATPPSLKTCRNNTRLVTRSATRSATRPATRTDVTTRALHVATVSVYWASLLKSKKKCIEIRAQLQNPINM